MSNKYLFIILTVGIILQLSCFNKLNRQKKHQTSIMSTEEIDNHLREQVKERGEVDWAYVSDEVLYSAAMHEKSGLFIIYCPFPGSGRTPLPHNDENYKKTGKLPQEWIKVRDEIIQYILEKERAYRKQPDLTASQILYAGREPDETLPHITVTFSDPSLISDLRNNELIRSIEPGYTPILFPE